MTLRSRRTRTIALRLRDARGRFMCVLPTLDELAAEHRHRSTRHRPRRVCVGVELALF